MKETAVYNQVLSHYYSAAARRFQKYHREDRNYIIYCQGKAAEHAKMARRWLFKLLKTEPEE